MTYTHRFSLQYLPLDQSPIEGYIVYYRPYSDTSAGAWSQETLMGGELREHTVRALRPNTQYSLRLTCFNTAGESPESNSVVMKTLSKYEQGHVV